MTRTVTVTLDADDAREAGHALTALSVAESRNPAFAAICDRVGAQLIASAKVDQVTAETLTDEQVWAEITRLEGLNGWTAEDVALHGDCLGSKNPKLPEAFRAEARARIAAAINARGTKP